MIIAHYAHRLPADHDVGAIRKRAKVRGQLWDAVPQLYFKAFLLRERGHFGAIANEYSSLYLWREDEAFRNFLVDGRYRFVTDTFGRAAIETRVVLDASKGSGREARFAIKQEQDIPLDADLTAAFAAEIERNSQLLRLSVSTPSGGSSPAFCCPKTNRARATKARSIRCSISRGRCSPNCRRRRPPSVNRQRRKQFTPMLGFAYACPGRVAAYHQRVYARLRRAMAATQIRDLLRIRKRWIPDRRCTVRDAAPHPGHEPRGPLGLRVRAHQLFNVSRGQLYCLRPD
jgi:Domain of unknown function (DUF4865)